jgi:hypothetical protein
MQYNPRLCHRFTDISVSERILNSFFLLTIALGYLFSLGQIFFSHQGRDGLPGLSIKDVIIAYHGSADQTRLAAAINGPMAINLKYPEDKQVILDWINSGAARESYENKVAPILQRDCITCHAPASGMNLPALTNYEQVSKLTEAHTGASIPSLVRISHIHLFGIAFILFFVGKLFILCDMPVWLKRLTIGIPFMSMLIDIFAWYLTRENPVFAYLLVFSGALLGLSLNFQIGMSLYQMWLPTSHYHNLIHSIRKQYTDLYMSVSSKDGRVKYRQNLIAFCNQIRNIANTWTKKIYRRQDYERFINECQKRIKRWQD